MRYCRSIPRPSRSIRGQYLPGESVTPHFGHGFTNCAPDVKEVASVTDSDMVDNLPACRRLFDSPHQVHQDSLPGPLLPIIPRISPSAISKEISIIPRAVKIHAEVVDRDQWSLHNTLIPNVIQDAYYLLYHPSPGSRSVSFLRGEQITDDR